MPHETKQSRLQKQLAIILGELRQPRPHRRPLDNHPHRPFPPPRLPVEPVSLPPLQ